MLSSRLVAVAEDILSEYKRFAILDVLKNASNISVNRNTMNDQQYLQQVTALKTAAGEIIAGTIFLTYPEDLLAPLQQSEFRSVLPARVAQVIIGGFPDRSRTSAISSAELNVHLADVENALGVIRGFLEFARRFGIERYQIPEGKIGIDVRLPRSIFNNELSGFREKLGEFDRFLKIVNELNTGSREDNKILYISTSEPVTTLIFAAGVAWSVLKLYKLILEIAEKQLNLIKAIRDLRGSELEEDAVPSIGDEHIKRMVERLVARGIEDLMANVNSPLDAGRLNEIKTELKGATVLIVSNVAAGARLAVTAESQRDLLIPSSDEGVRHEIVALNTDHLKRLEAKVEGLLEALDGPRHALIGSSKSDNSEHLNRTS